MTDDDSGPCTRYGGGFVVSKLQVELASCGMEERIAMLEEELRQLRQDHQELIDVCKGEFQQIAEALQNAKAENEQRDQALAQVTEIVSKMLNNMMR